MEIALYLDEIAINGYIFLQLCNRKKWEYNAMINKSMKLRFYIMNLSLTFKTFQYVYCSRLLVKTIVTSLLTTTYFSHSHTWCYDKQINKHT